MYAASTQGGVGQTAATTAPKTIQGVPRLSKELDEIHSRLSNASARVAEVATCLFGSSPEPLEGAVPPSADTLDARLGEVRRALSFLEGNIARLHQG